MDTKISAFPAAASFADTDVVLGNVGGVTKKIAKTVFLATTQTAIDNAQNAADAASSSASTASSAASAAQASADSATDDAATAQTTANTAITNNLVADTGWTANASVGDKTQAVADYAAVNFAALDVGNIGLNALSTQVSNLTKKFLALEKVLVDRKVPNA